LTRCDFRLGPNVVDINGAVRLLFIALERTLLSLLHIIGEIPVVTIVV
jgi:hypothetical protein